jgi:hypothetical protein
MKQQVAGPNSLRQKIFNACSATSLLLFGATAILWVHSYWRCAKLQHSTDDAVYSATANAGIVIATRDFYSDSHLLESGNSPWELEDPIRLSHYFPDRKDPINPPNRFLGFGWAHFESRSPDGYLASASLLAIPIWAITLFAAMLPALRVVGLIHRRRQIREGLCTTCGYNLTANTSGVCPECGMMVSERSTHTTFDPS